MKKIVLTIIFLWISSLAQAASLSNALGEEKIEPVFYPKFSISGDYSMGKKFVGFDHDDFKHNMPDAYGVAFAFEAGLYRYFNAGGILALHLPLDLLEGDPIIMRLLLFAKPFYPVSSNFAIFSRIGGGIMSSLANSEPVYLLRSNRDISQESFMSAYDTQNNSFLTNSSFGASAFAGIGMEFFPISRLGIAIEGGVRADFSWILASPHGPRDPGQPPSIPSEGDKTTISYMTYDFPITVTLHTIF